MISIDQTFLRARRLPWWQIALILSVVAAIVIALVIVTAGLVLLLAPVVFLALLFRRLSSPRPTRSPDVRAEHGTRVIDAEFEIIDAPHDEQNRRAG